MEEERSKKKAAAAAVVVVIVIILVAAVYLIYFEDDAGAGGKRPGSGDNIKPTAKILTNWTANTRVNDLIEFNATQSSDSDGEIVFYSWAFGDYKKLSGTEYEVVNHSYAMAGTYTVNLSVRDDDGGYGYATEEIIIRQSDYHDEDSAILSASDILPFPLPSNATFTFDVDKDAARANITLTIIGGSSDSNDNFFSDVDILISDPYFSKMVNRSIRVRGTVNESYEFYQNDLYLPGSYTVAVECKTGSINVDFEVRVFY